MYVQIEIIIDLVVTHDVWQHPQAATRKMYMKKWLRCVKHVDEVSGDWCPGRVESELFTRLKTCNQAASENKEHGVHQTFQIRHGQHGTLRFMISVAGPRVPSFCAHLATHMMWRLAIYRHTQVYTHTHIKNERSAAKLSSLAAKHTLVFDCVSKLYDRVAGRTASL